MGFNHPMTSCGPLWKREGFTGLGNDFRSWKQETLIWVWPLHRYIREEEPLCTWSLVLRQSRSSPLAKSFREHCLYKTYILAKDPYSKVLWQPTVHNIDILLECGDYVKMGKDIFKLIWDSDQAEFNINHKLTPAHSEVDNCRKCSVSMAAQVMSATSAAARWKTISHRSHDH